MPLKKFGLRALVGRKHRPDEREENDDAFPRRVDVPPPPPLYGRANGTMGHASSAATTAGQPAAHVHAGGFCSSVQYERLTTSSSSPDHRHYEEASSARPARHMSPNVVMYERMTPPLGPGGAGRTSPSPDLSMAPVRRHSPNVALEPPRLPPAASALKRESPFQSSPAISIPSLYSPSLLATPSPGRLSNIGGITPTPTPTQLHDGPRALHATAARNSFYRSSSSIGSSHSPAMHRLDSPSDMDMDRMKLSMGIPTATPAPPGSDGSTPFSIVMEEWMSQLRTPTPDVMLLPSPMECGILNKASPASHEEMSEIKRSHDPLLPTPPPDLHTHKQPTNNGYLLTASNSGPLEEAIATLCRDLISQELNKRLGNVSARLSSISLDEQNEAAIGNATPPISEDYDENSRTPSEYDDEVTTSTRHSSGNNSSGGSKSKRRKMCTVDGCTNLSRSRGLCKAHGGGRRCSVEGCTRASQSGSLCITHGGGKRCTVPGCQKAAQSRGMCKAHGGGVRCRVEGCQKSSQGDGYCRTHGGGRRCGHPSGCNKWAQRNGMCMAHSEGRYGNSYRGRLARQQEEEQRSAAEVLTSAKESMDI